MGLLIADLREEGKHRTLNVERFWGGIDELRKSFLLFLRILRLFAANSFCFGCGQQPRYAFLRLCL